MEHTSNTHTPAASAWQLPSALPDHRTAQRLLDLFEQLALALQQQQRQHGGQQQRVQQALQRMQSLAASLQANAPVAPKTEAAA